MVSFKKVGVIGCGKMAKALIDGAVKAGTLDPKVLMVTSPSLINGSKRASFTIGQTNEHTAEDADLIFLGTKPKDIPVVCQQISKVVKPGTLFFSMAAGVPISIIMASLNGEYAVERGMPNLGCMVGSGVVGCFSNQFVTSAQAEALAIILRSTGKLIRVPHEDGLNNITAISGSGPGYLFEILRQFELSAVAQGFDDKTARELAVQTLIGAADYLRYNPEVTPEQARNNVTSPNGTTYAALKVFKETQSNLEGLMRIATQTACDRAEEMGREAVQKAKEMNSVTQIGLFQPSSSDAGSEIPQNGVGVFKA